MDQIANMLITLKHGGVAGKQSVAVPYSGYKASIAKVLLDKGYITSFEKKSRDNGDLLLLGVKYVNNEPRVHDVKRISKSSRRVYMPVKNIRPIKFGFGMTVLSTPKGVLSDDDAKKEQVGGEVLFEIW